ncbi:MAG TPA: hypothetical protein VFW45_08975 [Candidatus Polarisedimenticolia bacterium]|nr:hypothetical protein [Candidatus Polarisedimenticolia bacterium]
MKLGSWLIARGRITGIQLKRALLDQSFYGGHLSSSLLKLGYLDEATLATYLSELFKVPSTSAEEFKEIPPEVIRMIPEQLAQKYQVVPLQVDGKKLRLAMMNPGDILVMDEVSFLTGMQVEPRVSSETHLLDALELYYHLPRVTRETIPLSDRVEGRENPLFARNRFMEQWTATEASDAPAAPKASPGAEEIGLDGRPLSLPAEVVTDFYPTPPAKKAEAAPGGPLPRSMDEWRDPAAESRPPAVGSTQASPPEAHRAPEPPRIQDAPPLTPQTKLPPAQPETGSASRRAALSLVPPPAPPTLEQVSERLRDTQTREQVFDALLDFCAGRFARSAVFLVTQDKVVGQGCRGEGFDPIRIRSTTVSLEVPSIFSYFRMGSEFYYGPVPGLPANQNFYRGLGLPPPERILMVPLMIKERVLALLYGDYPGARREEPDIALYRRLVQKATLALEVLILRNKIMML